MTRAHRACATLLAVAALSAMGCAGSSSSHGPHDEATQAAKGVRRLSTTLPPRGGTPDGDSIADVGATAAQRARHPRGTIADEVSASTARQPNPCELVTEAQAQTIMQRANRAPVLASQGPTCIYASRDARQQVTISILSGPDAAASQATLHDRMRVKVGDRHAYCGVAGGPALLMALSRGRLIDVSAPCPTAASFAADALSRLSAMH